MIPSGIPYLKLFKDFSPLKANSEHLQLLGDIQVVVSNCDWKSMAFMAIFHFLISDQEKWKIGMNILRFSHH